MCTLRAKGRRAGRNEVGGESVWQLSQIAPLGDLEFSIIAKIVEENVNLILSWTLNGQSDLFIETINQANFTLVNTLSEEDSIVLVFGDNQNSIVIKKRSWVTPLLKVS